MRRATLLVLCLAACGGNVPPRAVGAAPDASNLPATSVVTAGSSAADRALTGEARAIAAPEPDLSIVLPPVDPEATASGPLSVVIDNVIDEGEWRNAERFVFDGSIRRLWLGTGEGRLLVRVDFSEEVLGDGEAGFDLYFGMPGGSNAPGLTPGGTFLGFEATRVVSWRGLDPIVVTRPRDYDGSAVPTRGAIRAGFDGTSIEFAIPLSALPEAESSESLRLRIVDVSGGPERAVLPEVGPAALVIPPPGA